MKPMRRGAKARFDKAVRTALAAVLAVSLAPAVPGEAQAAQLAPAQVATQAAPLDASAALWDGTVDATWYDAEAIEFTLTTPAQLAGLAAVANGTAKDASGASIARDTFHGKTVRLGVDVMLNAFAADSKNGSQRNWTPIGNRPVNGAHEGKGGGLQPVFDETCSFRGTFDGRGHEVRNIYICTDGVDTGYGVRDYGGYQGLFGVLGEGAVVKNVGIRGGFIAGRVAGGIAALGAEAASDAPPMILNCFNTATIEGDGSSSRGSGGIFGGEQGSEGDSGNCYIANCYNAGAVKGKKSNSSAPLGGIAGRGPVKVYSCYDTGTVASSLNRVRGALVGVLAGGGAVVDSYALEGASSALYADGYGNEETDGLLSQAGMNGLAAAGKLSAAFVDAGGRAPALFWEGGWADPVDPGNDATLSDVPDQGYSGSAIEPAVTVAYGGTALKPGSDYYMTYADNVNAGTASFTVNYIGAYDGTRSGTFRISNASLATATVAGLGPQWIYGSEPVVPDIVVKDAKGNTLREGRDYDADYEGNDHVGTAKLTLKPHEGGSYAGELAKEFKIVAASTELDGSGTPDDPYLIKSRADMQWFAHSIVTNEEDVLEGAYRLAADVNMTGDADNPDVDLLGASWYSEGEVKKSFAGAFDGAGHTVTMNFEFAGGYTGLFPTNAEGTLVTVKDLTLAGSIATPPKSGMACALFPSVYGDVALENVTTTMSLSGYKAYGLIGEIWPCSNSVSLAGCANRGAVTGAVEAAGLVGMIKVNSSAEYSLAFADCSNAGAVTAGDGGSGKGGQTAAGILGSVKQFSGALEAVSIERTGNSGAVAADGTAGGLIAVIGESSPALGSSVTPRHVVSASCNTGPVTAGKNAGGLVGALCDCNALDLANVYNTGDVSCEAVAGGLLGGAQTGAAWYVDVSGAYNTGTVTGAADSAGAIAGFAGAGHWQSSDVPSGAVLAVSDAYYLEGSAPADVGTVQGTVVSTYVTFAGATLTGSAETRTAAQMKTVGAAGMAASINAQFSDAPAGANGGYPVLYWQAGKDYATTDISAAEVGPIPSVEYTGELAVPVVTVTFGGKQLKQGSDFSVRLAPPEGAPSDYGVAVNDAVAIAIEGIGLYSGTIAGHAFKIVKADIGNFTIDAIRAQWGSDADRAEPVPVLRDRAGAPVPLGTAFDLDYEDNTQAGTGSVTVTAAGSNASYEGELTAYFTVRALPAELKGSGTGDDPFQIDGAAALELFAKRVNSGVAGYPAACAKLTRDVSIAPYEWLDPIGTATSSHYPYRNFTGTFDGDGHSITLNYREANTYALFDGLEGATVKNLVMKGVTTTTSDTTGNRAVYGGTFTGVLDASATFENCVNEATVVGTGKAVGGFAPAVDGKAEDVDVTFRNCVNRGTVIGRGADGAGVDYVGGFVGYAYTMGAEGGDVSLAFENCVNCGPVTSEAGSAVGGILGGATYDYDTDSYDDLSISLDGAGNQAAVSAFDGAGGLVGIITAANEVSLKDVYNTGAVSVSNPDAETGEIAGGLVGVASGGSYLADPELSVTNAYNAGEVTCTAQGGGVDPLLGGVFGGLSFSDDNTAIANVYYSLDKTIDAIGMDQSGGNWEDGLVPELDETMLDASFVEALGSAFMADGGENAGFPVLAATKTDLSGFTVATGEASYPYNNGLALEAPVTVTSPSGAKLVKGVDYNVFYEDNVNAGTATATVVGTGAYYGSASVTFEIAGKDIASCRVAAIGEQLYTGSAITPAPVVTDMTGGKGGTLLAGVDYTVSYANNVEAGTASVLIRGTGRWKGAKAVTFRIWEPLITVRTCDSKGNVKVAKRYRQSEFEALASGGDPVSALYYQDGGYGWKVSTAKTYVTFDDLFADAGAPWGAGASVSYVASDAAEEASKVTYEYLNDLYFYPEGEQSNIDVTTEARKTPPVLAIEECSSVIGLNYNRSAEDAEKYNVEHATAGNEPRVVTGITEADAANPASSGMGSRLVKGLKAITVHSQANPMTAKAKAAMQVVAYNSKGAAKLAASKLYTVGKAKGEVTYSKLSGDKRISVAENGAVTVAKGTPVNSYKLKVRVSDAGAGGYEAGSKSVSFTVSVRKANTMTASARATKAKPAAVAYSAKKDRKVAAAKLVAVGKAKGQVSYQKKGGNAKIVVARNGAVTVKRGLRRGTYPVKVDVTAAGNSTYLSLTRHVTFYVKVK